MKYDLICIGMALVDSIIRGFNPEPVSASGYVAESGSLNAGGEAVNEAIAAAKLGLKTGILCALGNDPAGEIVLDELRKNGVDTELIVRTDATPVTTRAPFDDPAIIHTVVSRAKEAGQLVLADTKLPNFRVLGLEDIRDSLKLIDIITPNEDEARHFTGKDEPEEMADVLLGYGVKHVIIKLGSKGCLLKNSKGTLRLQACNVQAVDATGAGDNFAAGFTSEILRGAAVEDALKFANACGAICTTATGAGTALKSREQVLLLMKNEE